MNVNCIVSRTIRLAEPTKKITLHEPLAYNNQFAHAMQVVVVDDDNQPVELTGVSVVGTFLNNDGVTVDPIVGAVDGNVASVLLPPGCYVCPGWYRFTMNLVSGDASRTVLWVEGMVERNVSGNISDPGTPVGNIEQAVVNANDAAAAANTAAANATKHVAPTEAASTASADHAVGEYFVYGGKLYVTMSAISAGDTITPDTNCEEVPDGLGSEVSELKGHFPATGKFVTGTNTSATEENAVAEGEDTIASGLSSHAEGYSSEASGDYSHSEGGSVASGGYSHAEGSASEASGDNAHAEGYETTASSDNSHSEGWGTTASGMNAHAEGVDTVASGNQSHAEGEGTIANHAAQSVSGTYNVADPSQAAATAKGTYAEIVGNGTADNARSNARTLDWSGNEDLAGDLTINKNGANEMTVGQELSDLKSAINLIADKTTNYFLELSVTSGKFCSPDGSTASNASWGYCDFYVTAGQKVSFNAGGRYMTSFASAVPVIVANHVDGGKDTTTAELVTIPEGATVMRFSFLLANQNDVCIVKDADKVYSANELPLMNPASSFNVYDKESVDEKVASIIKTNYVSVSPTDNLRTALESITDSSFFNRYVVMLGAGTYDISTLYTAEEKAVANFAGLFVPPWCTLYGIGGPENVILTWVENSNKGKLSTINLYLNSGIENVTVKAEHLRYAVHDDWVSSEYAYEKVPSFIRKIENCVFENKYSVVSCYGSGVKSGCAWKFDNCTFKATNNTSSAFYIHNNNGFTQAANVEFDNCRFIVGSSNTPHAVAITSLNQNSNVINNAVFKGCSINYGDILLGEDNAGTYGAGIKWKISGYANTFGNSDVTITNTDGQDYSGNVDLIN